MRLSSIAAVVAALSLAVVACGSDDDDGTTTGTGSPTEPTPGSGGGSGGTSCEQVTKTLCEKACACGSGGKCVIQSAIASEEHESLADCTNFYRFLVCSSAATAADYESAACRSAVSDAACTETQSGKGVAFPTACNAQ
jgi:hypothetical protein